jgi:hypothetical protein
MTLRDNGFGFVPGNGPVVGYESEPVPDPPEASRPYPHL